MIPNNPNLATSLRRSIEPSRQATTPTPSVRTPVTASQRNYRRGNRQGGYRR